MLSSSCTECSPTFLSSLIYLFILGCSKFLLNRSSILPFEETFWVFYCRMCVTKLWLEENVSRKLISLCPCFSLYRAQRRISWLQLATCRSDCWRWFWVWNCGLACASFQCLEMYTGNKHEFDILDISNISDIGYVVDTTYSCGNIWKRMQFS